MTANHALLDRLPESSVSDWSGFSKKVARIRDEIIEAATLPLAGAVTTPRGAYVDEEYFRFEAKSVLEAGWICVAHVSQIKAPGNFVAIDLLDEPIVLVRGQDNAIRALSRVCVHRAMDIMPEGERYPRTGKAPLLMCPYHHWTYDLDGRLKGCPEMQRVADFRKADWRLAEFRCEVWEGFIFVNLDGKAPPLAEQYADLVKLIAPWRTSDMEIVIALEWDCPFNWKVMIENWTESYHHLGTHNATLNPLMPAWDTWAEPEHPHFIRCHLPYGEGPRADLARAEAAGEAISGFQPIPGLSFEQRAEWGVYLGHPCFMFLTTRDRVIWYRLQPIAADRCKLLTTTLVSRESLVAPDFAEAVERETKMLSDFHLEDMEVNEAVQRGLKSAKAVRGRLSHLEEPVWLIQRFLAARAQGTYPGTAGVAT